MTKPSPNYKDVSSTDEPVRRWWGAKRMLADVPYIELLDHSKRLGRVARWDWAKAFGAAGLLCWGGAIGALAAGSRFVDTGVWVCGLLGAVLVGSSLFIRRERVDSVADLKADFDQTLSYYEHDEGLREVREQYGVDHRTVTVDLTLADRCRRFLRL